MRIAGVFAQTLETDARLDPDLEEPLGIEYVLAVARASAHEVRLFTALDAPLSRLGELVNGYRPDVVAFSVFTTHAPACEAIARQVKCRLPDVVTVAGGPHPSAVPEFVLAESIDICVLGEGERTFCQLLDGMSSGQPLGDIPGLSFEEGGIVRKTGIRGRIDDLDALPRPARETRYYRYPAFSISHPPMSQCNWRPVLFSRGCSLPCRFCSSRRLWGNAVRFRSAEDVVAELRDLCEQDGVNSVFFEDLTFTLNQRRFLSLCGLLKESQLPIRWACETHVNTVDERTLAAMQASGCTKILWGVETTNDAHLARLGKQQSQRDVARSLGGAAKQGILNWGCCIIGFPWETEAAILGSVEKLLELDIHQLRIAIATPLPGSQWYDEMPRESLDPDLSLYDTNHLVYDHPTISAGRMKELQNELFVRFYSAPRYRARVASMIKDFPHLRESFDEFLAYIDAKIDLLLSGGNIVDRFGPAPGDAELPGQFATISAAGTDIQVLDG